MKFKEISTVSFTAYLALANHVGASPVAKNDLSNLNAPPLLSKPTYSVDNISRDINSIQKDSTQEDFNHYISDTFKNLLESKEAECPSTKLRFIHHNDVYNDLLEHPDIKPKLEDGTLSKFDVKAAIENAIFINCPNTRTTEDSYKNMMAGLVIAITVFTAGVGGGVFISFSRD